MDVSSPILIVVSSGGGRGFGDVGFVKNGATGICNPLKIIVYIVFKTIVT